MAFSSVVVFLPDDSLELFEQPGDLTAATVLRQYPAHQLQLHVGARRALVPADKVLEPGSTYHVVPVNSAEAVPGAGGVHGSGGESKGSRPRTPTLDFSTRTVSGAARGGGGCGADSDRCAFPPLQDGKGDAVAGSSAAGTAMAAGDEEEQDAVPPLRASRGGNSAEDDARAGMAATAAAMMLTGRAGGAGIPQRDGFLRLMAEIHDGCDGAAAELDLGPPVIRSNRKSRSNQQAPGDSSSGGREGGESRTEADGEEDNEEEEERRGGDSPRRPRMSEEFISVANTCMTDPDMSGGEKKRTLAAELADMSTTMTNVMVQSRMMRGGVV